MKISAWGETDVGSRRDHNEDALVIEEDMGFFAVADGMGGHQGGECASCMAVEGIAAKAKKLAKAPGRRRGGVRSARDSTGRALAKFVKAVNREIFSRSQRDPTLMGMGATLTAMLVRYGWAYVVHVGDSRCYQLRDGKLEQLTADHSWVAEQLRAGLLSPAEAEESAFRHIVTRSVGYEPDVLVDVQALAVAPGDRYLLCTDGLSNALSSEEIAYWLSQPVDQSLPRRITQTADAQSGEDNITAIVIAVTAGEDVV